MRKLINILLLFGCLTLGIYPGVSGLGAAEEYHGADSVFKAAGVGIVWAILKGADEEHSMVVIRIDDLSAGNSPYRAFGVLAVHPFSSAEQWVLRDARFDVKNSVRSSRASFRDMPGRRILLYKSLHKAPQPDLVIYYMSVPDTAPEFLEPHQLENYLNQTVERLKK